MHDDGTLVGSRGHAAVFAFYANKQMTTGEGGMVVCGDAATKVRIDSERNQGRAPDMGWLDHDRLGFNYRLTDLQCALGVAQLERLDEMLADRARVAVAGTARRCAGVEGLTLPAAVAGPQLVRLRRPAAAPASTATRRSSRCASAASRPSRTCRRSTS